MPNLLSGGIQELFFLVLRLMAAAGGFLVGWYVTGPALRLPIWLIWRRSLPRWFVYWCKLLGGAVVAVLVFWLLPLGLGGGGGGSGGGTGKGVGPGTDGIGAKTAQSGKSEAAGKPDIAPSKTKASERVVVELLGGDKVKDGRYYLIEPQSAPVDGAALAKHLRDNLPKIAGVDVVLTDDSVGEAHPAYRYLQQLVLNDLGLQLKVVDRSKKV